MYPSRVVVLGAGTMGAIIGGEFARIGSDVVLVDLDVSRLDTAVRRIRQAHQVLIESHNLSEVESGKAIGRISLSTDVDQRLAGADFVIEALPEVMSTKQEVFQKLDRLCKPSCVFASNTSGLSVATIAQATARPEKVAGMHFWNPPHVMPLVEVTKSKTTSCETANLVMNLARALGKRPILVKHDIPGFVGNRLQFAVLREALFLLSKGIASAEDIDTAMTHGPGLRYAMLGPLRTADLGGLDVFLSISNYLFPDLSADKEPPALLRRLVAENKTGAKSESKEGIYPYTPETVAELSAKRDRILLGILELKKKQCWNEVLLGAKCAECC